MAGAGRKVSRLARTLGARRIRHDVPPVAGRSARARAARRAARRRAAAHEFSPPRRTSALRGSRPPARPGCALRLASRAARCRCGVRRRVPDPARKRRGRGAHLDDSQEQGAGVSGRVLSVSLAHDRHQTHRARCAFSRRSAADDPRPARIERRTRRRRRCVETRADAGVDAAALRRDHTRAEPLHSLRGRGPGNRGVRARSSARHRSTRRCHAGGGKTRARILRHDRRDGD